jgi:hypothetical protein
MKYLILLILFGSSVLQAMDKQLKNELLELTLILKTRQLLPELVMVTLLSTARKAITETLKRNIYYKPSTTPNHIDVKVAAKNDATMTFVRFTVKGTYGGHSPSAAVMYTMFFDEIRRYNVRTGQLINMTVLPNPGTGLFRYPTRLVLAHTEGKLLAFNGNFVCGELSIASDEEEIIENIFSPSLTQN